MIKRSVDNGPEKTYKFTGKFVLKGGAEVTVWSSGSGMSQDLPTDLVSKNDNWGVGEQIDTTLVDASGEVSKSQNLLLNPKVIPLCCNLSCKVCQFTLGMSISLVQVLEF